MKIVRLSYQIAEALAAFFVAAIAAVVVVQIIGRLVGFQVKGGDDFAAWSMAAATFLALPQTMAKGEHIRITLLFQNLSEGAARILELIAETVGFLLAAWAAWSVLKYVHSSYQLGDVSQGELSMRLWIPQLSMAIGMALLAVACAERIWVVASNRPRKLGADEISHVE